MALALGNNGGLTERSTGLVSSNNGGTPPRFAQAGARGIKGNHGPRVAKPLQRLSNKDRNGLSAERRIHNSEFSVRNKIRAQNGLPPLTKPGYFQKTVTAVSKHISGMKEKWNKGPSIFASAEPIHENPGQVTTDSDGGFSHSLPIPSGKKELPPVDQVFQMMGFTEENGFSLQEAHYGISFAGTNEGILSPNRKGDYLKRFQHDDPLQSIRGINKKLAPEFVKSLLTNTQWKLTKERLIQEGVDPDYARLLISVWFPDRAPEFKSLMKPWESFLPNNQFVEMSLVEEELHVATNEFLRSDRTNETEVRNAINEALPQLEKIWNIAYDSDRNNAVRFRSDEVKQILEANAGLRKETDEIINFRARYAMPKDNYQK